MSERTVYQSMPRRLVVSLGPAATVHEAACVMTRANCGSVLIIDSAGTMQGILTERDLMTRVLAKGLDADAQNGPLTLRLPDEYASSVRVETSTHSPLSCRAAACEGARREDGNRNRLLEIGGSDAVVRLSSVNGPVSIVSAPPRS